MSTVARVVITAMWSALALAVVALCLIFYLIYAGVIGYMPPIEDLKNPTDRFASVLYTADGVEMGRYYQSQGNRVYVDYDQLSPHLTNALIATEDARFESHSGIDFKALVRAVVKRGLLQQKNAGGGSTITQQLAKQLYSPESTGTFNRILQKPIEWVIAVKLERYYTKDEIIRLYFNQFDFLNNAVGIETAAYVYFGKDAGSLSITEAATLVGMVKNPSYFNPVRHGERARSRRNVVLQQMYKADMISKEEFNALKELPLTLDFHRVDHKDGIAPYFREELRRMLTAKEPDVSNYPSWNHQAFVDDSIQWAENPLFGWCAKNRKPDGTLYNIYTDGLKIYTTIDSRMQQYAEDAVLNHLGLSLQPRFIKEKGGTKNPYTSNREELSVSQRDALIKRAVRQSERYRVLRLAGCSEEEIEASFKEPREMRVFSYSGGIDTVMTPMDSLLYTKSFLRTGMMSMDPVTGFVKAYVGGPSFKFFQYDMVSTGRRQIGSTIKPFLYTYAMEEGYTPCDKMLNSQPVLYDEMGNEWMPRNSGKARIDEMVDLRWALTNSNNWISARLMDNLSPAQLVKNMHNFGITNQLDAVKALCLGPCDVSVREMVTAYSAFANKGMRVDPLFVTQITDNQGNILAEFTPQLTECISEDAYYKILSILLNVVDEGTGNRLRRPPYSLTAQIGGKTGTTNYNADGWFMCFTPQLVTGVWVGGEERYIHFNTMANGQGAEMALPISGRYLSSVLRDPALPYSQDAQFEFPEDFDPCKRDYLGGQPIDAGRQEETVVESISGVFD